jgi:dienelactone hydrolase
MRICANSVLCMKLMCLCIMICAPAVLSDISGTEPAENTIAFTECLVISGVSTGGRAAFYRDAVDHMMVTGTWLPPGEGDTVTAPDGTERSWERLEAVVPGRFEDQRLRGWAYMTYESDIPRTMILRANYHSMLYVNGEPRTGDIYGYAMTYLPVRLERGINEFLFNAFRGRLDAELVPPQADMFFTGADHTLPDLVAGEPVTHTGAVVVVNATEHTMKHAIITAYHGPDTITVTDIPDVPPLTVRKVPFRIEGTAPPVSGDYPVTLTLGTAAGTESALFDTLPVTLEIKDSDQPRRITFVSDIDGSVQYFALNPAQPPPDSIASPAIVLSCHGAGVEAIGLARAYSSKTWAHIVCPTNRRPFGFDWEDWGRLDAMEVLNLAQKTLDHDPSRVYLTGHSMGGHGTWHLGVTFPDPFAAIGPSAGWISFWHYGGAYVPDTDAPSPQQTMLRRLLNASDTKAIGRNLAHQGIYILHGADDDNVPVTQAHAMIEYLEPFHRNFRFHEEPDAKHWWDKRPDVPGTDCVDWPPMFDYFASQRLRNAAEVIHIEFHTASPGVSSDCHWVSIDAQHNWFDISSVDCRLDPAAETLSGTTQNVRRLGIDTSHLPEHTVLTIDMDDTTLSNIETDPANPVLWLEQTDTQWAMIETPCPSLKGAHRAGPFRDAFRNRMLFVYGTQGTDEENTWAYAKARYDAEQFWYRANGSVDVIADTDFDMSEFPDRNIIVYGNRNTNAAWPKLFDADDVDVVSGSVRIGEQTISGYDRACLVVRPRPDSDTALVAAVSGTGIAGMRLTNRLPYFVSGTGYADVTVFGPDILMTGVDSIDVMGFFGHDWSVENGEFVWKHSTSFENFN